MTIESTRRRRTVVDFLVIFTGVALIGFAMWALPLALGDSQEELANVNLAWIIYFAAGALALASQFVGQWWRRRNAARILLALGAVLLFIGLTAFRDFGPRALLTMLLPAILLLIAIPMVGPMPDPEPRLDSQRVR